MAMDSFVSHGKKVPFELFQSAGGGKQPAIVVAYGTEGMNDSFGKDIRPFASDLAGKGYVVLIPHYFERTDTTAGFPAAVQAFVRFRDACVETLGDALSYVASRSDVKDDQISLLGFSLGGHLSLRAAKVGTGIKVGAVVEFFAPITQPPFNDLGGNIVKLPPTQIHHGEADHILTPQQSRELERLLVEAGKQGGRDYEIHFYPGEGHGFQGTPAVATSKKHTLEFLDRHIKERRGGRLKAQTCLESFATSPSRESRVSPTTAYSSWTSYPSSSARCCASRWKTASSLSRTPPLPTPSASSSSGLSLITFGVGSVQPPRTEVRLRTIPHLPLARVPMRPLRGRGAPLLLLLLLQPDRSLPGPHLRAPARSDPEPLLGTLDRGASPPPQGAALAGRRGERNAAGGYQALLAGLHRTEETEAEGEAWAPGLVTPSREELERFADVYCVERA